MLSLLAGSDCIHAAGYEAQRKIQQPRMTFSPRKSVLTKDKHTADVSRHETEKQNVKAPVQAVFESHLINIMVTEMAVTHINMFIQIFNDI